MKISCVIGHLHVDTRPLRQALSPITQRAVDDIKASVLDAARREATTTMARYKRRNETLARRKEGLDAFVQFARAQADAVASHAAHVDDAVTVDGLYEVRSIHWSPYDPVRVVNADP